MKALSAVVPFVNSAVERAAKVGKQRFKVPAEMTYTEWRKIYIDKTETLEQWERKHILRVSGALSGALNPDSPEAEAHAFRYYGLVRSMKTDCKRIADNTGFREKDIHRIKNHVFYEKHELYDGEIDRFYPSYRMAQSWQRLIDGKNILEQDIVLLNHEFLESIFVAEGFSCREAHDKT